MGSVPADRACVSRRRRSGKTFLTGNQSQENAFAATGVVVAVTDDDILTRTVAKSGIVRFGQADGTSRQDRPRLGAGRKRRGQR